MSRTDRLVLLGAGTGFLLLAVLYFPPMYLASDEAGNLAFAQVLAEGTPFADRAGLQIPAPVPARGDHLTSRYPPGLALLLAPFCLLSLRAAFLLPLVAHLATFAVLAWLMRRTGISPLWSLLHLFYPTALLHSRTLMSNAPAAALLLASFALLVSARRGGVLLAGLLIGLGTLVRQPVIIGGLLLGLGMLWRHRRELLEARGASVLKLPPVLFAAGTALGLAVYFAYHSYVFGSPLVTGYEKVRDLERFGLRNLVWCLPRYVLILMLVYPLMLLAPAGYRGKWRLEVTMVPIAYLLFYGSYSWFDASDTLARTLVSAPRFLLPAVPFLLLAYAGVLSSALRRLPGSERIALVTLAVLGLCGAWFLCDRHYRMQRGQALARDAVYAHTEPGSVLVCSVDGAELVQERWGHREILDLAESSRDSLVLRLRAGRPVYLVGRRKSGSAALRRWTRVVERKLRAGGQFQLDPVSLPSNARLRVLRIGLKAEAGK